MPAGTFAFPQGIMPFVRQKRQDSAASVRDLMLPASTLPSVERSVAVFEGMRVLSLGNADYVLVFADGRPQGILMGEDFSRLVEAGCDLWRTPVGRVMRKCPPSVAPDEDLQEVSRLIAHNESRLALVTDRDGTLLGTVERAAVEEELARAGEGSGTGLDACALRILDELADTGVVVADERNTIVYFNQTVQGMFPEGLGIRKGALLDEASLAALVSAERMGEMRERLSRGTSYEFSTEVSLADSRLILNCTALPLRDETGRAGSVLLLRDVTRQVEELRAMRRLALRDHLTGLPNRAIFMERLEKEIKRAGRYGGSFAVMLVDLDNFKEINDEHGHIIGDVVLKAIGKRLTRALRDSDTVARFGGDEFTLVLPEVADDESARAIIGKIDAEIALPVRARNLGLAVGVSVGYAIYPRDGATGDELISLADMRMYEAKRQRKGQGNGR
ncbi:diguanylate cyclase [Desulfovibrio sp. X2]|uniref:diguanylate cyclase domain-containing protein n=1 Tax=Desulfovibrio sp. X2 TaxID=941449 RepID=UPI00068FE37B|nr:diguanylate cyclase [Desulfovibrio sp. X2]